MVGVNTTAEIESAIVGRNVFAVLAEDFKDSQDGTVHFGHLRNQKDGLLHVASDLSEHARQLDQALGTPDAADDRRRRFVERFVRPYGVEKPATPRLVKALEALAASPSPALEKHPWWGWVLQARLAADGARLQHAAYVEVEERSARVDRRAVRTKARAARRAREASKESAPAPAGAATCGGDSRGGFALCVRGRDDDRLSCADGSREDPLRPRHRGLSPCRRSRSAALRAHGLSGCRDLLARQLEVRTETAARLRQGAIHRRLVRTNTSRPEMCSTTSGPTSAPTRWWRRSSPGPARASSRSSRATRTSPRCAPTSC